MPHPSAHSHHSTPLRTLDTRTRRATIKFVSKTERKCGGSVETKRTQNFDMTAALHVAFVPSAAHAARIRTRVRVSTRPCAPIPTHQQHARRPTPSSSSSACSGRATVRASPNADLDANANANADPGTERRRKSIAVFVSGGGSNFRAIHADILDGSINGDVTVVVTNAPGCAAAVYAREHGIPVRTKNSERCLNSRLSTSELSTLTRAAL